MNAVAFAEVFPTFSERVTGLLERVDFRRADSEEEREAIFRLRYNAYLREGAIASNLEHRFTDQFDEMGNSWIFGVHLGGRLVSSIWLNVATAEFPELPALHVFGDELAPLLDEGKIIIDPTRLVVDREAALEFPKLVYVTVRLAWAATEYFRSDLLLATVRAEHQSFYRRVFGHRVVVPPRSYPGLNKSISLMTLDNLEARGEVHQRYPFFRSTYFERRMLFERLQPAAALRVIPSIQQSRVTG
jgi:hypothetical protein